MRESSNALTLDAALRSTAPSISGPPGSSASGFGARVVVVWLTRGWWTVAIARSLVCDANGAPSDAILVENFDPDYLVFERATRSCVRLALPRECSCQSRPTGAPPTPMPLR